MTNYIQLRDGRHLCYFDQNPRATEVIISLNGTPSDHSALLSLPGFPFLESFRHLIVDRPGYGESDVARNMHYTNFADDIEQLTSSLKIGRFYIHASSGGAPWALATGLRLPEKVRGVILVSPVGPLTDKILASVNRINRRVYKIARVAPWLMRLNVILIGFVLKHWPDWYLEKMKAKMSTADLRDMEHPQTGKILTKTFKGAVRQTSYGLYLDVINQANPWDFNVEDVKCPVIIYQANQDHSAPKPVGEFFESHLPNCRVHFVEDAGHLWHLFHMPEILRDSIREIDMLAI